jgi:beta-N-acetylglucosaminidase
MKKKWFEKLVIFLLIMGFMLLNEFTGGFYIADAAQTGVVTASRLNVRAKPSTLADKVHSGGINVSLIKGTKVNILKKNGSWYYISTILKKKKVKGYVLGSYIKITSTVTPKPKPAASSTAFKKNFTYEAKVICASLNVRKGPATTYSKTAVLKKGAGVTIVNEITVNSVKWYGISFTYKGKKKKGYVSSKYVKLSFKSTVRGKIAVSKLYIRSTAKRKAAVKKNSNGNYISLKKNKKLYILKEYTVSGVKWYKIFFYYGGKKMTGYVMAKYVAFRAYTPPKPTAVPTPAVTPTPEVTPNVTPAETLTVTPMPAVTTDFEALMSSEGFPDSYKDALRQLHTQYPNWVFRAYHTGIDWSTVIALQSKPGKNLLSKNKSIEWKSLESGAYNWSTDKFTVFDGTTWVTASIAAIEYYMDPRNFLTPNTIFQFELLKYQNEYQNTLGVENILKGTVLYNTSYTYKDENDALQTCTYGDTFIKAAEYSGVSPYHLASRVKQEVVTSAATLSASVTGTYKGYEGYYNFFNIGANDSAGGGAIANALKFAKNGTANAANNAVYMLPWTSPYNSILGGSCYIGKSYINRGQDTVYLQKFNVTPTSTYYHQYMTNVEAPYAEAKKIYTAYGSMADMPIVFSIPVYINMPEQTVSMPMTEFNPNNRLKSLKLFTMSGEELLITPTFDQTIYSYDLIVPDSIDAVEIQADTVSKKASAQVCGYTLLDVGSNQITIPVVAENGDSVTYIINIVRE